MAHLWAASATLNGTALDGVLRISVSGGVGQDNAAGPFSRCTITTALQPPAASVYAPVVVMVSSTTLYTGLLLTAPLSWDGGTTWTLTAVGKLHRLTRPYGGSVRVYNPTLTDAQRTTAAVVTNLIEAYGVQPGEHIIYDDYWLADDGSVELLLVGAWEDFVVQPGDNVLQIIQEQLDQPGGMVTYDQLGAGVIQRDRYRSDYADPSDNLYTFASGQAGIISAERLGPDVTGVKNWCTVEGASYHGLPLEWTDYAASAAVAALGPPEWDNPYLGQTVRYPQLTKLTHVQQAAALRVQDWNHVRDGVLLTLEGHAAQSLLTEIHRTATFDFPEIGVSGLRARIIAIQHDLTPDQNYTWRTQVWTNGGSLV